LVSGQSFIESARTLALVNIALADAGISCWDTKYEYDLWRPIDAIRKAGTDGNAMTQEDASWTPLLVTPPFPAYTSGHSTFSGASAEVLTAIFGASFSFTSQKDLPTNTAQLPFDPSKRIVRSFRDFNQAAEEASWSRVYGGIHFLFDGTEGLESGYAVGALVYSSMLRPKVS
jgi:membrane-associated phospholipid phosphatase